MVGVFYSGMELGRLMGGKKLAEEAVAHKYFNYKSLPTMRHDLCTVQLGMRRTCILLNH
jgi:hypothetical protein